MQQQLTPFWSFHQALCIAFSLLSQTHRALVTASPRVTTTKTRMEIREQDFSFNDDTREQPLIEVVTNASCRSSCSFCKFNRFLPYDSRQ
ncbi:unnamed protein product [Peronospora belbahrii]|uniref:Secreted protein n=1 Tax=Peronospora belbahrii TaxID=622444 RepID=A0ABN8D159_9STRA|nr:unnamed protein product [Peronospora belbahrii]